MTVYLFFCDHQS